MKYSESKKVGNRVFRVERQDQTNVCLVLAYKDELMRLRAERCGHCWVCTSGSQRGLWEM